MSCTSPLRPPSSLRDVESGAFSPRTATPGTTSREPPLLCLDKTLIPAALSPVFELRREYGTGARQMSAFTMLEDVAMATLDADKTTRGVRFLATTQSTINLTTSRLL